MSVLLAGARTRDFAAGEGKRLALNVERRTSNLEREAGGDEARFARSLTSEARAS